MKAKFIFPIFIVAILFVGKTNAQIIPAVTRTVLSEQDKSTINQHLNEYITFTIDKKTLVESLYNNGRVQFQIRIDEKRDWLLDLQPNDMRAPDFRQTYITDKGKFEFDVPFVVNTFKGKTSDNRVARFTIDENNFFGVILSDQYHYVIRPARDYTRNSSDKNLIVHKSSDVIPKNEYFDYINDALEISEDAMEQDVLMRNNTTVSYTPCTYYLKIATDADYEFYQVKGSDLARTYGDMFSILNIVEGVYESTFNLKFIVTYQNVWTTTSNGYTYTSTNHSTLLSQFRNYWNSNMTGISRNIAHLFTGKNIGAWGVAAAIGQISNSLAYAVTMFAPDMQYTVTHEIGHLLNARDANLMNPVPPECLCDWDPLSLQSVMCQGRNRPNLWFCQTSIDQIGPFLTRNSTLLTGDFPANLTLTGTVSGFNEYKATQKITSNQVINSGYTVYKAGEIVELGNSFEVKLGAGFEIIFDDGCP